jgi:penicillin-binding protein 1A
MTRPPRGRPGRLGDTDIVVARRRQKRKRRSGAARLAVALLAVVVLAVAAGSAVFAFGSSCDLDSLQEITIGENTFVYAAGGTLLGSIPAERNRQVIPIDQMSLWLPKATVAIEDRRYYQHDGVDVEGIARAMVENARAGGIVQGGSTITQQLVRNLYISREQTVQRKVKEACLAVKLERAWGKDRVLATYLNSVFYGNLAYGVEAAAQTYFSKQASELTLAESALLAGLTQAPTSYDPFVSPDRAVARRDEVLTSMRDQGMITRRQYVLARRQRTLVLKPGRLYSEIREPYFFSYVREKLVEAYGAERVRSGGLKVYTTIIPRWQVYAQQAIRATLTERTDPAAALISIDPRNGAIRAMTAVVPSRKNNQFNLLSQARRQPGSTFKTFVLTAAVAQGIDPTNTVYVSAPFTYRPEAVGNCEDGSWWCVKTYDSSYNGWTSVRSATIKSDNSVYAQLTLDVTPKKVAEMAQRLGVRSPLDVRGDYVASMGLGTIAVSPLDMASGYATLAAGGMYTEPRAIRRVVLPDGTEDASHGWSTVTRRRVIPDGVAWEVTRILEENVRYGTGTRAQFGRDVAGKTGTTDEHADAWFVGYTPDLTTAVWMGFTTGEIPMTNVHGISVSGGSFPAEMWRRYMQPAIGSRPALSFPDEPRHPAEFTPHTRGPWALTYDPYAKPVEDDKEKKDKPKKGTATTGAGSIGVPPQTDTAPTDTSPTDGR